MSAKRLMIRMNCLELEFIYFLVSAFMSNGAVPAPIIAPIGTTPISTL